MRRASLLGVCVVSLGVLSCTGVPSFGPYSSSSLGSLAAGVAGFVPGTIPGEGQFLLTIVNTDKTNPYNVLVTPIDDVPVIRTVTTCGTAAVVLNCTTESVLIELQIAGQTTSPSLTIVPDPDNCLTRIVYIEVEVATGTDTSTSTVPPSLTETLPASAVNCTTATQ